jgi:hypothetical protein
MADEVKLPEPTEKEREAYALAAIRQRIAKWNRDALDECRFGSMDTYSGMVADQALMDITAALEREQALQAIHKITLEREAELREQRDEYERWFKESEAARTCVTCKGLIMAPMQCGYCIEHLRDTPEGMPERPVTLNLKSEVESLESKLRETERALLIVCVGFGQSSERWLAQARAELQREGQDGR